MKQRVPRRSWCAPSGGAHRPRVLIENDHPALAISDFSMFERAGFDVAFCSGPDRDVGRCPVLAGQQCPVVSGADAVLHGLDQASGVAAAIHGLHPGVPVVVAQRHGPDGSTQPVPAGCIPLTVACSVRGQIEALRRALDSSPAAQPGLQGTLDCA